MQEFCDLPVHPFPWSAPLPFSCSPLPVDPLWPPQKVNASSISSFWSFFLSYLSQTSSSSSFLKKYNYSYLSSLAFRKKKNMADRAECALHREEKKRKKTLFCHPAAFIMQTECGGENKNTTRHLHKIRAAKCLWLALKLFTSSTNCNRKWRRPRRRCECLRRGCKATHSKQ